MRESFHGSKSLHRKIARSLAGGQSARGQDEPPADGQRTSAARAARSGTRAGGSLLAKAEVSVDAVKIKVHRELEKLPRVSGGSGDVGISSRLNRLLGQAEDEAKKLKDEYISVEHLLLAMLDDSGAAGRILQEVG